MVQVSLEGRENFQFEPQDGNRTISNQTKFFQSESHILGTFPEGLPTGLNSFNFQIDLNDDGKRPSSFNCCEDTRETSPVTNGLGKGFLTLQVKYFLKVRAYN